MNKLSNLSLALTTSLLALSYACSDDSGSTDESSGGNAGTSTGGRAQGGQNTTTGGSAIRGGAAGNTIRGGNGGSSNLGSAGTSAAAGGTLAAAGSPAVLTGGTATSGASSAPAAGQFNLSGAAGAIARSGGNGGVGGARTTSAGQSNSGGTVGSAVAGAKGALAGAAGNSGTAGSTASQPGAGGSAGASSAAGAVAGTSNAGAAGNAFQEDPRCPSASPTETLTAHLRITADNECDVYVNGQSVGQTTNWGSAVTIDVSLFVHPGRRNVVAVVGRNTSSQGGNDRGIIGELTTTVGATTTPLLVTDEQWSVAHTLESNWTELSFDDSSWPAATEIASNGDGPWGNVLGAGSLAKWIWFAPVPTSTSDKPNEEATFTRRVFYFDFAGQLISSPLCYAP